MVRAIDAGLRNPVMAAGSLVSGLAIIVIVTNALANQPMRHPSPLFNTRTAASSVVPVTTTPIVVADTAVRTATDPQPVPQAQAAAPRPAVPPSAEPDPVAPALPPISAAAAPAPVAPSVPVPTQLTQRIQQGLRDRGFYTGALDGLAGPATSDAIRLFEQRLGVAATGDANERVLALLKSERGRQITLRPQVAAAPQVVKPTLVSAPVTPRPAPIQLMPAPVPPEPLTASAEGRIQKVQRALNVAGYGLLRADGHFDDKTAEAIRKYEAEHGMPITGRLSERLVSDLLMKSAQAR
jgi:peptidoglycan hydrolase-like protein with peptidoglycan-binding domain